MLASIVSFRREPTLPITAEEADAFRIDVASDIKPLSLLDRSKNTVASVLDRFGGEELRLENEIAERHERLRQVRVIKRAYEAAGSIMDEAAPAIAAE